MTPARVWGVLALLYVLFFGWYTSFGGPLTDEEIAHYTAVLEARGGDPARLAVFDHFMRTDTGDDFAMFNAIELRESPERIEGVLPGETSEEVLARYSRPFMAKAMRAAAHPVLLGSAASPAVDIWGIEGADDWTMGGLVRYRSRRDLMKQIESIRDDGIHDFKIAAMAKTVAYPLDPWFQLGDPRLVLALVLTILGLSFHLRTALSGSR